MDAAAALTCLLPENVRQEATSRFGKSLKLADISPLACIKNLVRLFGFGVGKALTTSGQLGERRGGVVAALLIELLVHFHGCRAVQPPHSPTLHSAQCPRRPVG